MYINTCGIVPENNQLSDFATFVLYIRDYQNCCIDNIGTFSLQTVSLARLIQVCRQLGLKPLTLLYPSLALSRQLRKLPKTLIPSGDNLRYSLVIQRLARQRKGIMLWLYTGFYASNDVSCEEILGRKLQQSVSSLENISPYRLSFIRLSV